MARARSMFTGLLILGYIPLLGVVLFMWVTGSLGQLVRRPTIVQSVGSPDGTYVAYVSDGPSIDPPNQSLLVERKDKTRLLVIAKLAEDIDSTANIVWSPDGQVVVFLSRCYLAAARLADWQTIRIYLGKEWLRHRPTRRATFSGAQPIRRISAIEFPGPDTVAYQIDDESEWNMIHMSDDRT